MSARLNGEAPNPLYDGAEGGGIAPKELMGAAGNPTEGVDTRWNGLPRKWAGPMGGPRRQLAADTKQRQQHIKTKTITKI